MRTSSGMGLAMGPELAVADGALGFWQAVEEVWPKTRGQRLRLVVEIEIAERLPGDVASVCLDR
jgi:putative transposase